jgi:hypothetical protein
MSETLNVNVLVAAKDEYTRQLVNTIQHDIFDILKSIFNDSQEKNIRRKISYSNFQIELKAVPQWTSYKLDSKIKDLMKKYPFLMDLITAIFVSHVKILACVRLKSDNKSIKIKVPNLSTFLHKLIIKCCETLYYEPQTINFEKYKIIELIAVAIDDTIANQIPIEYILNEYLAGAFDEDQDQVVNELNLENPEPINDDMSGEESEANSEEDECKNIPILPIKNRAGFQESLNEKSLNEESLNAKSLNDESLNEEPKIECTNKNEQNNDSVPENTKLLNKSSKIDDISDEEYSDEDISGEELSDEESEKTKKNRSLF